MKYEVFQVFDSKAMAYGQPWLDRNSLAAKRKFASGWMAEEAEKQMFAADYTLFHVGSWDDETGRVTHLEAFENLGTGLSNMSGYAGAHRETLEEVIDGNA